MKIRITGTPDECRVAAGILSGEIEPILIIGAVSQPYPNRGMDGGGVRIYVDADLPQKPTYSRITSCCVECGVYAHEAHEPECRWRIECQCRYCRGGAQ